MRKFIVNVNGTSYEVDVEEITGVQAAPAYAAPATSAPVQATPVQTAPAASAPAAKLSGNEKTVNAPMPGSIISVNVKPGDSFRSGQVLLVLEAMKMENEIMAPHDGTVVSVNVHKGASVNSGDVLVSYK